MTIVPCDRSPLAETLHQSHPSIHERPSPSHPWHKLPVEITEHIFAQWHGKDTVKTVRHASQVSYGWAQQVQRAQAEAFAEVQQQAMLSLFDDASRPSVDNPRLRTVLQRYHRVAFHLTPRAAGIEARMYTDAEALAQLPILIPRVDTLDLRGLKDGCALFAHLARSTPWLHGIQRLTVDSYRLTEEHFERLLQGTLWTPGLQTLSAQPRNAAVTPPAGYFLRNSDRRFSSSSDVEGTLSLHCAHLAQLQTLDLGGCGLDLSLLQLHRNERLRHLNVSGNVGIGHLLLGPGAPPKDLETLVLSPVGVEDEALARLSAAPWAQALQKLTFVGEGQRVPCLNLARFDGLVELTLKGLAVNYRQLHLPHKALENLDLTDTGLCRDNPHDFGQLQQPHLWRLYLAHNALHGMLQDLNLFAAPNLLALDLENAFLRDVDIIHWPVPGHNRLRYLNLSNNKIGQRGMRALLQKPLPQLRYLGLAMADRRAAADVAKVLQEGPSLKNIWPNLDTVALYTHHLRDPGRQEALQDFLAQDAIANEVIDLRSLGPRPELR